MAANGNVPAPRSMSLDEMIRHLTSTARQPGALTRSSIRRTLVWAKYFQNRKRRGGQSPSAWEHWLKPKDASKLAALIDLIEMERPEWVPVLAGEILREALVDGEVMETCARLAVLTMDLGRDDPGSTGVALVASSELDRLVADPVGWTSLVDVLGEAHSDPEDLLAMARARLERGEGDEWALLMVMTRLRVSVLRLLMRDRSLSEADRLIRVRCQMRLDLEAVFEWERRVEEDESSR